MDLDKTEMDLLIDVCNYVIKDLKKKIELFNEQKMEGNMYLIELIEDIAAVMDKIDIRG